MKKQFTPEDIPSEVWWVFSILMSGHPVGMKTCNEIHAIIEKYPEHFPWEHLYKSIPESVHDAFSRECYPERYRPFEEVFADVNSQKGLMQQIRDTPLFKTPSTQQELIQMFDNYEKRLRDDHNKKIAEQKRIKSIWDKHYKKYGLECREF